MSTPPPLPEKIKPIRRAEFKESKTLSIATPFDYRLIESTNRQAEYWINQNPKIDLINIETFHSSNSAITVVWYR